MVRRILVVKDLWFRYPNSGWILKSLDLEVYEGEVLLIIGRSGCGKTTLIRTLVGIGTNIYGGETRGSIEIDGRRLENYSIEELRRVIQIVNQDPRTHFIYPNIHEDLFSYSLHVYRDKEKAKTALDTVSKSLKIEHLLNRPYFELSGGELRRVVIAKAMLSRPRIIVFDEPFMWLDDTGVKDFLEAIEELKNQGVTILIFEHRFMPLVGHINRVLKFSNGSIKELPIEALRKPYSYPSMHNGAPAMASVSSNRKIIIVNDLWFKYDSGWILKGISMNIHDGETIAIYGHNGSGKSTLLKIIAGYLKPKKGIVRRFGKAIYIPQLVTLFFTEESIDLELRSMCRGNRDSKECYSRGRSVLKSYGFDDLTQTPFNLSWGQQEKLAVALSLIAGFSIFLLDEPFSGLTYLDRAALIEYLEAVPGAKILTTSSRDSIPFLKKFRLYKLIDGYLVEERPSGEILQRIDLESLALLYGD